MNDKLSYIKKEDRKKILLLSDDMRLHSGIATMAREIVVQTAHHYNWVNLGGAMNHPDDKKAFDLSPWTFVNIFFFNNFFVFVFKD